MTREEWDSRHVATAGEYESGETCGVITCHADGVYVVSTVHDYNDTPRCRSCGPRPPAEAAEAVAPAQPEPEKHAPERKQFAKPDAVASALGNVSMAASMAAFAAAVKGISDMLIGRKCGGESDAGAPCPHCAKVLPTKAVSLVLSGSHDCPSCGWHSGRCEHCHELLVPTYKPGVRDGSRHCPRCGGVDDV